MHVKCRLIPILLSIFQEGYPRAYLKKDLFAGLIVGILSLPMSIAFAIASGVRPEQGLYTAIIAGFFGALFGGSRFQVSGPTGAFVILIFSTVQKYGYEGLAGVYKMCFFFRLFSPKNSLLYETICGTPFL
jgi:SulP family sulfate permease